MKNAQRGEIGARKNKNREHIFLLPIEVKSWGFFFKKKTFNTMYSVCLVIFLTLSYICNICATICDIKTEFFFLKKKKENPGNKFTALTSPEKSALGLFSQSWTIKSKLHFFFKKKGKK